MKVLTVIGARPQFIKAVAVNRSLKEAGVEECLVHTGQHFDENMSDVFFNDLKLPRPDHNLNINSLSHGAMTGRMLEGLEEIMVKENPDLVLVYGDTNSTLAGALAARKLHIKLAHVEAGLRSYNMNMPEEVNRILSDRISDLLFCPTDKSIANLENEGYEGYDIEIVKSGDVMLDAAKFFKQFSKKPAFELPGEFILLTLHREENTSNLENRLQQIVRALNTINKEIAIVWPMHPRTSKVLKQSGLKLDFIPVDPVGYLEMLFMLERCQLVITDSGGLQKEAFFFKKNCVTLRDETEWTELTDNGFNILVGANEERISNGYKSMCSKENDFTIDLYGKGDAANIIAKTIQNYPG